MKQLIRKLTTLLLLFTCSIGAWAQGNNEPSLSDGSVSSLLLKHNFGENATVTFYLFGEGEKAPAPADISNFKENEAVTSILEYTRYVVAHVVPAAGYWTNEALLYARLVANQSVVQQQVQTRGTDINGSIEVKLIQLDGGRNDGAGWYYFEFPEVGIQREPSSGTLLYESLLLDGYVLPKFDLSGDALKSNDGKSFTFTVEDNWITELSIDVALTDETAFYYNASAQGPTKLTNSSIVVKRFDATENKYVEVVKFDGADNVAKHVTSELFAEEKSSLTIVGEEKKAIDAGSYYLRLQAARTESNESSQTAPAQVVSTRSGQNSATANTVETGIFTSFKDVEFTINQKEVEIVPTVNNKVYDGTTNATIASVKVETGIEGEALKYVSGLTAEFEDANVGTGKTVSVTGTPSVEKGNDNTKVANYDFTVSEDVTADITAKLLTITAEAKSKVYGTADPALTYTKEGLLEGDAITGSLTRAEGENVGEYAITQGTLKASDNYEVTFIGAKLTIKTKTIKDDPDPTKGEGAITIELNPTEYTYDKTEKKPAVTVKDGETTVAATEYQVAYTNNINAGAATVTITDKEGGNYTVSGTKTFTIKQAKLTITAEAKSKKAGEADPELTYKTEGLVEGDALTGALTRAEGENVGEYAITQGTLKASDNYEVTFTGAKLTINSADFAEGDVTAVGYEGTYDGKPHTITVTAPKSAIVQYGKTEGTYGDEVLTFTNVGENTVYYKVTMANTNPVTGNKKVVIKKAKLTITADAKEKKEGEADPALTYTTKGLVEGEKLEGALTREAGETAGEYAIIQGTLKASDNYDVTFVGAKLTITAKPAPTPTEPTYRVTVQKTVGGEVITSKVYDIKADEQVNMIITPDEKYYLESLTVAKAKGGNVPVRDTEDAKGNKFKAFNMPADDAIVTAIFAKIPKPNEDKQNIFIFKANYGEVVSNTICAANGETVNLVTRKVKGYEDCVLNELYIYNEKFQPLPIIQKTDDAKEGTIYTFVMSGEKAFVYNTFKGTNGTVDDSNPLPPDYRFYLFSNMAPNFLKTNKGSAIVQLALTHVANILATFTETDELKVDKGIEDIVMKFINAQTGWLINIDFEGTIKALAPQLLQLINSNTRGTEEGTPLDSDGTILSGATYRVLEDTNLELLLESTTGPLLIKSISVMAPEDDDPTGISRLKADEADVDIYDLRGRKVDSTNLRKGVYIKNGRKVVIK